MTKKVLVSFLLLAGFAPLSLSAATIADLQSQINAFLAQITALQAQVQKAQIGGGGAGTGSACVNLARNLSRGMSGEDVTGLQTFLKKTGDFAEVPTGFFGAVTEEAVKKWQARTRIVSDGTPATTGFGAVGPKTRAAMACATIATASLGATNATPATVQTVGPPPATRRFCLHGSAVVAHAASIQLYSRERAHAGETCKALAQARTCEDGVLSGSTAYTHLTCAESDAQNCSVGGAAIPHGSSVTLYSYTSVLHGDSCTNYAMARSCSNGVLSGDAAYVHALCVAHQGTTNDSFLDLFYTPQPVLGSTASGASCKSVGGDRVAGVTLSEQLITGGTAATGTILPWYVCDKGMWQCTAFCEVGDQRLWQEGGIWKSNTTIMSQVGATSIFGTSGSGAALPDMSGTANPNSCMYQGASYPMGMRTEGVDVNNLCLGADLSACLVETTVLPQFECRSGTWQRAATGGTGQGLPSPTTYPGDCTPGNPGCHFCQSGSYGFWTTALTCPASSI